jgi:hypothetical protein
LALGTNPGGGAGAAAEAAARSAVTPHRSTHAVAPRHAISPHHQILSGTPRSTGQGPSRSDRNEVVQVGPADAPPTIGAPRSLAPPVRPAVDQAGDRLKRRSAGCARGGPFDQVSCAWCGVSGERDLCTGTKAAFRPRVCGRWLPLWLPSAVRGATAGLYFSPLTCINSVGTAGFEPTTP